MQKTLTRLPWRTRTQRKKTHMQVLTPAEKQAAKIAIRSRKQQNHAKVDAALLEVWKLAEGLHRDIGTHSAQYWYEFLLQRANKKRTTRRPSTWNAFVSMRVRAHNEGVSWCVLLF
jgi:hypothetical protein